MTKKMLFSLSKEEYDKIKDALTIIHVLWCIIDEEDEDTKLGKATDEALKALLHFINEYNDSLNA